MDDEFEQDAGLCLILAGNSEAVEDEGGQPPAVVEAMKMANTLSAAKAGPVKALKARPGDSLAVDQVILKLQWISFT